MDSAIYLAVMFLYGISLALKVLLISILVEFLYKRKMAWWKHLFNLSMYSLMIAGAFYSFLYFGGQIGEIKTVHHQIL